MAYTSVDGVEIRVGRGSADNDKLSCDPQYRDSQVCDRCCAAMNVRRTLSVAMARATSGDLFCQQFVYSVVFATATGTPVPPSEEAERRRRRRRQDWWLHVAGHPGSHVVIRSHDNNLPLALPETLRDAAALAAKHSKVRACTVLVLPRWTRPRRSRGNAGRPS
jgi:hypothetical protein